MTTEAGDVDDVPERPEGEDPFEDLPPELRAMLEQLGGGGLEEVQAQLSALFSGGGPGAAMAAAPSGPVDWELATRVALQLAADGDRAPTDVEHERARDAFALAEHWLDATPLPAPPDVGHVLAGSRQEWVNAAVPTLRAFVEPVARAATDAMIGLARESFEQLGEIDDPAELPGLGSMEQLPPGFQDMFRDLLQGDPGQLLRPAGAALAGLQAGQVLGRLAQQLLGQYDLGIPTAPRGDAYHLAVNVDTTFSGYDLDATEVALVLALTEAAHRRLYHAIPWLEAHISSLVARFAAGTQVDADRLREVADELLMGVDPDDPDALNEAMQRASNIRLEPTPEQRRVLERLQGVVCLVGAWARHEVNRASEGRLPSLPRIEEVLRRRRATRGDGEQLLAGLLGLDLKPEDEHVGERFVTTVEDVLGPAGLHRALAHPENLPDAEELADPGRWLARTAEDVDVPDDLSGLLDGPDAPHEASAAERAEHERGSQGGPPDTQGGEPQDDDGEDAGPD